MSNEIILLCFTAATIGFFHTLIGPDHYLPFVVISKARNWSTFRVAWITFVCGLGHVLSSVVIGIIGIATGLAVTRITIIEGYRGNVAAWLFILFGLGYFLYGVWKAMKNKPHKHFHVHEDGSLHKHVHSHEGDHEHTPKKINITPWILFTIFVFGPCEPLIPLLMYPAAQKSIQGMVMVTSIFSIATIGTMMVLVLSFHYGLKQIHLGKLEKYNHALAGMVILLSGIAIEFLGL